MTRRERTVAVLGAGNMGTALAQIIAGNGHSVRLWSIETDVLEDIRDHHLNTKYLPGLNLHKRITPCWTLKESLAEAWLALFSVPSRVVRSLAKDAAPHIRGDQPVLNVGKGLEENTNKRMSELLEEELPRHGGIAIMGGPAIAGELACGVPTAVIVAAADAELATDIQDTLQNESFKVETTTDLAGVELGACLKNAYAIALGMCDGAGYGTNTKAFLASVALAEMARLSQALGGQPETVYGLAGLGDLITTGFNPHSRNRTLGEKLCNGRDWQEFLRTNTVEGVAACRARDLADRLGVATPLLHTIYDVVHLDKPPEDTMRAFLRDFSYG